MQLNDFTNLSTDKKLSFRFCGYVLIWAWASLDKKVLIFDVVNLVMIRHVLSWYSVVEY